MIKEAIINRTAGVLEKLPEDKIEQVAEYADFLLKRFEENRFPEGIPQLVSAPGTPPPQKEESGLQQEEDVEY